MLWLLWRMELLKPSCAMQEPLTVLLKQHKGFVRLALKTGWVPRFWCPSIRVP